MIYKTAQQPECSLFGYLNVNDVARAFAEAVSELFKVVIVPSLHTDVADAGKRLHVVAGVTEASLGCDLLISRREIAEFESDGYRLSAR